MNETSKKNTCRARLTSVDRVISAIDSITLDVEEVVHLADGTATAQDGRDMTVMNGCQRILHVGQGVGVGWVGSDTSVGEGLTYSQYIYTRSSLMWYMVYITYSVRIPTLKQVHRFLEVIAHFLLWLIVGVAARIDGVDTRAVGGPLVLPKRLAALVVADPVLAHVGEKLRTALVLQNARDVGVGAGWVAVGLVAAVAVVGPGEASSCQYSIMHTSGGSARMGEYIPETVDGPGVGRASHRVGIPELGLEESATGRVEAAARRRAGLAADRAIGGADIERCKRSRAQQSTDCEGGDDRSTRHADLISSCLPDSG